MYKKFLFILDNVLNISLTKLLNIFFKQNPHLCVLGLKMSLKQECFLHNSKYLFLYLTNFSNFNAIWLCDDKEMLKQFKIKGYKNVYMRNSIKGMYYSIIAKFCLYDFIPKYVNTMFMHNKININLWHGIPLKKIEYDDKSFLYNKLNKFQKFIYKLLKPKHDYFIVNSEYEQACYETAFLTDRKNIKIIGSPRLDVLLHNIPNSDLFMEKDFTQIKNLKEQGKKLLFYTPTFRDTGINIATWLKSNDFAEFLKHNNAVLVCKLHPADINTLDFKLTNEFYKMDSCSDIYPVLKFSDALITDYSSIYFDYLLLDKPIIYYPIDIEEYQEKCRGFYKPYEELTAGIKAYCEKELFSALSDVINGVDKYKENRKILRDKMFKYQDGNNCERVISWIRSLDNVKNS